MRRTILTAIATAAICSAVLAYPVLAQQAPPPLEAQALELRCTFLATPTSCSMSEEFDERLGSRASSMPFPLGLFELSQRESQSLSFAPSNGMASLAADFNSLRPLTLRTASR